MLFSDDTAVAAMVAEEGCVTGLIKSRANWDQS